MGRRVHWERYESGLALLVTFTDTVDLGNSRRMSGIERLHEPPRPTESNTELAQTAVQLRWDHVMCTSQSLETASA